MLGNFFCIDTALRVGLGVFFLYLFTPFSRFFVAIYLPVLRVCSWRKIECVNVVLFCRVQAVLRFTISFAVTLGFV